MGCYLRSEEMVLCELFLQSETAYLTVADLGEAGILQFRDLNGDVNTFQRRFVSAVKSADEMERKLRYMESEIIKDGMSIPKLKETPPAPNSREVLELEAHLEKTDGELHEVSHNSINLRSNFIELTELKHVLEKTQGLFAEQEGTANLTETRALIGDDQGPANISRARLSFVAGVIPQERVPGFEKMLWRISRGNVFLRQAPIDEPLEDPKTGVEIKKNVFVVFFQGDQLKSRVKKVCSGFRASIYQCPNSPEERHEMVRGVRTRLADLIMVLNQSKDLKHRLLSGIASELQSWIVKVKKMKAVYHTLNMFNLDVTNKCFIGECWVPKADLQTVKNVLAVRSEKNAGPTNFFNVVDTKEVPPTFNRSNKFTKAFQVVIDAYGIASYREINPALYSTITFPFLFGVMFGDCGHGLIVTIFAAWMVIFEKKLSKSKGGEIWKIFFGGRYLILLMGIFSIYTGLIYNDMFSKSLNIFGSSWISPYNESTLQKNAVLSLDPAFKESYTQYPYPFGMDPVWQLAPGNKIIFQNSFKMKLSIIIGVTHMLVGICLSVGNHVYFKNPVNIILEFIPQILFLMLLFLYMVVLMILKWTLYDASKSIQWSTRCAPSVLITFINMMLFKELEYDKEHCLPTMYPSQDIVQKVLVVCALVCIPILLLGKPLYILIKRKASKKSAVAKQHAPKNADMEMNDIEEADTADMAPRLSHSEKPEDPHEEEPMSEIFIHQAIHTIEYILSTISHTASYLRLWALSLAHGQLSEVLWTMVLVNGTAVAGWAGCITIFIAFALWAVFTLAILVLMEGLSAFLHTLRLHWVEFMSKFYIGEGYAYHPFSFKIILEEEDNKEED